MKLKHFYAAAMLVLAGVTANTVKAQTDIDALMMAKNNFCGGVTYSYSSWKNYWEGTLKRDNENLGKVSSQMLAVMGNYGITDRLNVLFSVPYVKTKATQGTLTGQKGFQDLSLWLKWMPYEHKIGKNSFVSVYTIGGFSTPTSNYLADYLPLAIGSQSNILTGRLMGDVQLNGFFVTGSATYMHKSNINIDRTAYYDTEMHLTNEVDLPDMMSFNFRTGYRSFHLIAEAILQQNNTLGGFDIRRNDMPFPSNKMNATIAGVNFKYTFSKKLRALSLIAGGTQVLNGRNVGQSTGVYGGVFYVVAFNKHKNAAQVPAAHSCKLCKLQ